MLRRSLRAAISQMTCAGCGSETVADGALCPACNAGPASSKAPTLAELQATPAGPVDIHDAVTATHFAPGQPFGDRYTIVEEVGAGGMGHVYKAIDRNLGKTVALKLVRPAAAGQGLARERFRRELALAQAVTHPNVCRVHDLGEVQGALYISMEFVEGQTLDDLIQSVGHLSAKQTVALGRQICAGLQAIHERGIVHRDLKPGNIMVDRSGHPILMDFGLAFHQDRDRLTGAGSVLGTLAYLSPEQARGRTTDHRSDLYGLGLILFEMLTGRRPPGDESSSPLALRESDERCPAPSRLVPDIPPGLDAVVLRCLEREPERRFPSATDLESALGGAAVGLSSGSTSAPQPRSRRLDIMRTSRARAVAAAGATLLVLAAVWLWRARTPGPPPPAPPRPVITVLPLDNLSKDPADDNLGVGMADSLITRLAAIPTLRVISRSATLEQRGRPTRAVARDLGATYIVNGGVQRAGQTIHVTLNLVRPDDVVAWGGAYDGTFGELFALHRTMAEGLSDALQLTLTQADRDHITRDPTTDPGAFADYSRALTLLARPDVPGNVDRAIEGFGAAIQKDPRFALAHAGLGEAYWAKYRESKDESWPTKAMVATSEALRLDPEQAQVRMALAEMYKATGRVNSAIEELGRAIALRPQDDEPHLALATILAEQGSWEDSVREARAAIQLRPNYWQNHAALGYTYFKKGDYKNAIVAYRDATELQPDNQRVFQMLGAAYEYDGDRTRAIENYERSNAIRPDPKAFGNIGGIYYAQGKYRQAAKALEESVRLDPNSARQLRHLGDSYRQLGEPAKARDCYARSIAVCKSLLRVNPADAQALSLLALSEAKLGRSADAKRHLAEATALSPQDPDVLYRKAVVHILSGEAIESMSALEAALQHGFSPSLARNDSDLAPLRTLPRYRILLPNRP